MVMTDPTSPGATEPDDVDELRAERDALEAKVHDLETKRRRHGRIRGVATFVLVVLTCISFTTASVGVWAKRSFLNNEVFADRAAPLGADPAVQAALTPWITNQIMSVVDPQQLLRDALPDRGQILAVPLANAVTNFVQGRVDDFVRSDTFATLWANATTQAHARAVKVIEGESDVVGTSDGQIEVNLVPLINEALAQVGSQSPEIFGRTVDLPTLTVDEVPQAAQARLSQALGTPVGEDFGVIRIDDNGTLSTAQDAVRFFNVAVWVLVILTILLIPLTLWLSRRRRRTLLQLVFGIAFGLVLVRRIGIRFEGDALDIIANPTNRAAASSIAHSFIDPLLDATAIVLWVLLAIAVVTLVTGPYRWAVALRRGARHLGSAALHTAEAVGDRATDDATVAWIRANTGALQIAGAAVAVLLLLALDLSWLGLLLLLILLAAYEAGIWWLEQSAGSAPTEERPAPPPPATGTPA
jgi:hypothetical protein